MQVVDQWSVEDPGGMQDLWGQKPGLWSGDMHYVWGTQRPPGVEKLKLRLPVEKTGKYHVLVRMTHAPYFGIFQLGIDGANLGAPIDTYSEQRLPADPVDIGTVNLTAGDHVLSFVAKGNNPAIKSTSYGFGLDYVKLVPAQ